jgi:hypothetical protein
MIHFDLSGAELFLDYLAGNETVEKVFNHPAYQIVQRHARMFSSGLTTADIQSAREGAQTNFYGLENLAENTPRMQEFLKTLRAHQTAWAGWVQDALQAFFTSEPLDITIYPIVGYDKGIGLSGAACLNINCGSYLTEPREFLGYAIHECVHVIYERYHPLPRLAMVQTPAQWRAYFNLWTHNEGYAVYVPLKFRQAHQLMDEPDYRVLSDPQQLHAVISAYLEALDWLGREKQAARERYVETCFGPSRLTYRVGCEIIRRIENSRGSAAACQAFYLSGDQFIRQSISLLEG